jgi:integrase/recombinase XerD
MVLDAHGRVGLALHIEDRIAKMGSGRTEAGGQRHRACYPIPAGGALRPNSIVNWFVALYAELELAGCSSHSGRRTFITAVSRALPATGGSLRDVQMLAGHRSIETIQRYIEADTKIQRRLIACL